jgi:pimeloyl-ACP methyl ester carboxylesterase
MRSLRTVALSAVLVAALAGAAPPQGCAAAAASADAGDAGPAGLDPSCPGAGIDYPVTQVPVGIFTFNVRMAGPPDGPAVLLLHGFPETSYEWRYQMQALAAAGYHVIAPDQRGYSPGARPPSTGDYSLTNLILDALGLMGALDIDRYHVVGHDWGAAVAWGVALIKPDSVLSLTSVSIPAPGALATTLADKTSCQYNDFAFYDTFVQPTSQDLFLNDGASLLRSVYAELSPYAEREYMNTLDGEPAMTAAMNWYRANVQNRQVIGATTAPVTVPTMVVWGDQDDKVCRATIDLTAQYVAAPYRLVVVPGADHWLPEGAAVSLNQALLQHLGSSRDF